MIECAQGNFKEFSPWNYNLLDGGKIFKNILNDDDGHDFNNSMVDEIIAKVLEDDYIYNNNVFHEYCTLDQKQTLYAHLNETANAKNYQVNTDSDPHQLNNNGFIAPNPLDYADNVSFKVNQVDDEFKDLSFGSTLSNKNVNQQQDCVNSNVFVQGFSSNKQRMSVVKKNVNNFNSNIHRNEHEYQSQLIQDPFRSTVQVIQASTPSNDAVPILSNRINYNGQNDNSNNTSLANNCNKSKFNQEQFLISLQQWRSNGYNLNFDYNNSSIESPPTNTGIIYSNVHLHNGVASHNTQANPMDNIYEVHRNTLNDYSYTPIPNGLDSDPVFTSAQQYSYPASDYQKCYSNINLHHNKLNEYKDYCEKSNVNNTATANKHSYSKKPESYCKIEVTPEFIADGNCKINFQHPTFEKNYPSPQQNEIKNINGMCIPDINFFKVFDNKTKSCEKQVFSSIDYSKNSIIERQKDEQFKFNCQRANNEKYCKNNNGVFHQGEPLQYKFNHQNKNNEKSFTISNGFIFKGNQLKDPQAKFQNNHKRSNNQYNGYKIKKTHDKADCIDFVSNSVTMQQPQLHRTVNGFNAETLRKSLSEQQVLHQLQQHQLKNLIAIPSVSDSASNAGFAQETDSGVCSSNSSTSPPPRNLSPVSFTEDQEGIVSSNSNLPKTCGSARTLFLQLEKSYEQFRQLEKERKNYEAELAAHFPENKVTSANNIPVPRLQGCPTRVDRVIVDHFREHARTITLIAKMERLRGACMVERIHKAMEHWLEAIKFVQECRKHEIASSTKRHKENHIHRIAMHDDNDILVLADSIDQLTKASRHSRTALYNAFQLTILHDKEIENMILESNEDVVEKLVPKVISREPEIIFVSPTEITEKNDGNRL